MHGNKKKKYLQMYNTILFRGRYNDCSQDTKKTEKKIQ